MANNHLYRVFLEVVLNDFKKVMQVLGVLIFYPKMR